MLIPQDCSVYNTHVVLLKEHPPQIFKREQNKKFTNGMHVLV